MVEPRRHHTRHRAEGDERRRKLRDARSQRKHLAVDARQRAAQAAVVGIEYGGGFRHNHRAASTHARRTEMSAQVSRCRGTQSPH